MVIALFCCCFSELVLVNELGVDDIYSVSKLPVFSDLEQVSY